MPEVSASLIVYGTLMFLGILGNVLVLITVISNTLENKTLPASDLILANLTVINFLICIFRNSVVFTNGLGLEVLLTASWCKFFMFIWSVLRSMSVWGTFSMSIFHYIHISNQALKLRRNILLKTSKALGLLWIFNFFYYTPALLYTAQAQRNVTFSVQLVSSSTRPIMGCVWNFPNPDSSLLYVTASLVIHELIPIFLMMSTNIITLCILNQHSKAIAVQTTIKRMASERRAARIITVLVILFVICWGTNVLAVNVYNFTQGSSSTQFLLTIANITGSVFVGFSPLVLLVGHSKLRGKLKNLLCKYWNIKIKPSEAAASTVITVVNF
ncbi:olfactory receptor class A-like protein 4 [Bombina bombina]|uniref:olfactory receptor class A-like protein 4 n=1 Tax=Bombina bombina TaxID=8345 RepID=UPI00235A8112|nr:olfactory receptor class A-like protein 4 [Bombina bombina]